MAWQIIRLDSSEAVARASSTFDQEISDAVVLAPQQDMEWYLDGKQCDPSLYYCVYEDPDGNRAHCLLRRHYRPIKVSLGEFTVYRHPTFRFELWSSPLLAPIDAKEGERIVAELLDTLQRSMARNEVLSIEGLPTDSALFRLLSDAGRKRLCLQLGKPFMHQFIVFPPTFDEYLQQLGKRSRKSVQYSQRRLSREFDTELFECDSSDLIDRFLTDAITVSKKTYQWNLLGLGLRNKADFTETLGHWARHADLCSFILYCDGTPTAFMLGYIYRSCYYYIDVGYDPDWAKYSVGSVLQLLVLERLYKMDTPPRSFDFSTGYGEHKGRFGNYQQEEVNILVLPSSVKNRLFLFLYRLIEGTSNVLVALLEKMGIKKKLKKFIRRSSKNWT